MAAKKEPVKKFVVPMKKTAKKPALTAIETALLHDLLENERVNSGLLPDGLQRMLDSL